MRMRSVEPVLKDITPLLELAFMSCPASTLAVLKLLNLKCLELVELNCAYCEFVVGALTSSVAAGELVPMPTLPLLSMRMRSVEDVQSCNELLALS
jgi:hypothetical protein